LTSGEVIWFGQRENKEAGAIRWYRHLACVKKPLLYEELFYYDR
jgi:hypothetical protein